MAQWKETLEPYVKVQEVVKTRTLAPTAGEDLIIGCVIVSDAGPSAPTLIQGQEEFVKTYSTYTKPIDVTENYIKGLDNLYGDGKDTIASTMWQNAYRLAGSNNLLVVRASKGEDVLYSKGLDVKGDSNRYVLRDGELLKKVPNFKIVLNRDKDSSNGHIDGFSINVNGVGILGCITSDNGIQYDYLVNTIPDLVDELNNTPKFFSPKYNYYYYPDTIEDGKPVRNHDYGKTVLEDDNSAAVYLVDVDMNSLASKKNVHAVEFEEVYLAANFIDTTDVRCPDGIQHLIPANLDWTPNDINQESYFFDKKPLLVEDTEIPQSYAINKFNTASNIKIRIRRFNHDAVVAKDIKAKSLTAEGESPYTVLTEVLDTFTATGTKEPSSVNLERDFFEVAVWDPGVNTEEVCFYNVGNISGRGDISVEELNGLFEMISVVLPEDLHELGLNYYGYNTDDYVWDELTPAEVLGMSEEEFNKLSESEKATKLEAVTDFIKVENYSDLKEEEITTDSVILEGGYKVQVTTGDKAGYYKSRKNNDDGIFADLTIDTRDNHIISVDKRDLLSGFDLLELDEVYTVEGLTDLGNTDLDVQKYIATKAINSNYFYPISTINSTNYLTIGNSITKLSSLDSYKLYASAPWDLDTDTFGWKAYMSPSVLYWEAVSRNRVSNEEFHGVFGQTGGVVKYQNPVCEFNKKTRQLLLSKKINTILWNTQTSNWNLNDNYTKQSTDTIMSDEGNSRLMIRISKAVPTLLKPYIGEKITDKLCASVRKTIDLFFKDVILPMGTTVTAYEIFCTYDENLAAQNKIKVVINVLYARALKYVNVVNNAFDVGMDISSPE